MKSRDARCPDRIQINNCHFSGKAVLNQKTELQRALEKQKERQIIAAQNEMNKDCTSGLHGELGKVIMERAQKNKMKDNEQNNCNNAESFNEEYLKARAKLRGCNKYTWYDEFNSPTSTVSQ